MIKDLLFNRIHKLQRFYFSFSVFIYSRPAETKILHEECGLQIRYSPNDKHILASISYPNLALTVSHLKSELPLLVAPLKLFGGLGWHSRLPYVCSADDSKLCFWKVLTK